MASDALPQLRSYTSMLPAESIAQQLPTTTKGQVCTAQDTLADISRRRCILWLIILCCKGCRACSGRLPEIGGKYRAPGLMLGTAEALTCMLGHDYAILVHAQAVLCHICSCGNGHEDDARTDCNVMAAAWDWSRGEHLPSRAG